MNLIQSIALINSQKQSNYIVDTYTSETKFFTKAIEKAQKFLDGKLPLEFIEFYSKTYSIDLITTAKTKHYPKEYRLSSVFSLEKMFDKFKPHPEPIHEQQKDYIKVKKSNACSSYFPVEFSDYEKFNEITRQKVLIPIYGTSSVITVDFFDGNKRGYTLKYLEARNSEIYPIDLSFTELMDYHLYFGTESYWFLLYIKVGKSGFQNLKTIKDLFGNLPSHQEKIKELEFKIKSIKI